MNEGVQYVVRGIVAVGTARIQQLPHFIEVGEEIAVPRQKLGEVIINFAHPSEKPDIQLTDGVSLPSAPRPCRPSLLPGVDGIFACSPMSDGLSHSCFLLVDASDH